ncbi:MAG: peptide deformylase [Candidatus Shapirobacteria bacterium]|nr:peptide deformylase [Candidatus Shapirobacteria bacterium]MDD4410307.1 peptide deformylase [Candidatus Shapirobacteria bacterium]
MRKIVIYPAEILRQRTEEIKNVDKKLLEEIEDLKKILQNGDNAAGLAAPQIGVNKRFFGGKEIGKGNVGVFINPRIEKVYGEKVYPKLIDENKKEEDFLEGCLSFPGFFGTVKRFLKIDVSWDEIGSQISNFRFQRKKKTLSGFEAIVFQHELDHLEGIVFIDHIKEEKGKFFKDIGGEMEKWSLEIFE